MTYDLGCDVVTWIVGMSLHSPEALLGSCTIREVAGQPPYRQARLSGDAVALALVALMEQHVLHQLHRPLLADHQLGRIPAGMGRNASAAG